MKTIQSDPNASDFLLAYLPDGTSIGSIMIRQDGFIACKPYGTTSNPQDLMTGPYYARQRAYEALVMHHESLRRDY
jgi:hypothetical protein